MGRSIGDVLVGDEFNPASPRREPRASRLTLGSRRGLAGMFLRRCASRSRRRDPPASRPVQPSACESGRPARNSSLLRASARSSISNCISAIDELLRARVRRLASPPAARTRRGSGSTPSAPPRRARTPAHPPALPCPSPVAGIGEAVERRQQLVQHADGAAGVEVVVHVLAGTARTGMRPARGNRRPLRLAAASSALPREEAPLRDALEALEEAIEAIEAAANLLQTLVAVLDRAAVMRAEQQETHRLRLMPLEQIGDVDDVADRARPSSRGPSSSRPLCIQ